MFTHKCISSWGFFAETYFNWRPLDQTDVPAPRRNQSDQVGKQASKGVLPDPPPHATNNNNNEKRFPESHLSLDFISYRAVNETDKSWNHKIVVEYYISLSADYLNKKKKKKEKYESNLSSF